MNTNTCEIKPTVKDDNPFSNKLGIFSKKDSPFSDKRIYSKGATIYSNKYFCPILLQENTAPLLLEDGNYILL